MSGSKRMKPSTDPAAPPAFMPTHTLTYRAQILHNFGLYDSQELETLDAFLENFARFGCEPLKDGLTNLFKGMQTAMDVYSQMKTEMHSLHVGVVELKQELTEAKEQHIAAETAAVQSMEEKCLLANSNYEAALLDTERAMVDRDNAISQHELDKKTLRNTIQRNQEAANVREKLLQEKLDAMKSELANATDQLDACTNQLAAAHSKQKQLTSQPGAPFYDSTTNVAVVCPVLQSNGHIVPLKSVYTKWFETAGTHDGYVFRTYVCPLMQQPTTLASLATQDRIRHIAQHAGINIDPPLIFSYMSNDGWTVFQFHDQLHIASKLCTIQTMQITESTEIIMVDHNTMSLEITAVAIQVVFIE